MYNNNKTQYKFNKILQQHLKPHQNIQIGFGLHCSDIKMNG